MRLRDYQVQAQLTDQIPRSNPDWLIVPLLGMAGEVGSLLVEYKKSLRDGPAHRLFKEHVAEELGDILWYLANVASKFDLDLEAIASSNLAKTLDRWPTTSKKAAQTPHLFDDDYPAAQQLPRQFVASIEEVMGPVGRAQVVVSIDGHEVGARIQDNAYDDDGYRFHDIFHLAHAAILGWSPVLRKLMGRKRKSSTTVDEVEDGGRAIVIDEAIVAFVFDYARRHNFLEGIDAVDYQLLKTVRGLVSGLEVSTRTSYEWERAILVGYEIWREIRERRGGVVEGDLVNQTLRVRS